MSVRKMTAAEVAQAHELLQLGVESELGSSVDVMHVALAAAIGHGVALRVELDESRRNFETISAFAAELAHAHGLKGCTDADVAAVSAEPDQVRIEPLDPRIAAAQRAAAAPRTAAEQLRVQDERIAEWRERHHEDESAATLARERDEARTQVRQLATLLEMLSHSVLELTHACHAASEKTDEILRRESPRQPRPN